MFITLSVLLGILVGLLRKGRWQNLHTFRFKSPWLAVVAIGMQILIFNPYWEQYVTSAISTNIIYTLSFIIILFFLGINSQLHGIKIIGLGIASNGVAIVANGGYMPMSLEALKNISSPETLAKLQSGYPLYNVMLINENTRFKFLCDIFYVPHINLYSIGDMVIAIGSFIAIQQIMMSQKVKG